MSNSFEIQIEITQDQLQTASNIKPNQSNIYHPISQDEDDSFFKVISLQQLLKTQHLLLEYQQKRKIERFKSIQYNYMNAYSNYLWSKPQKNGEKKQSFIFMNQKDIISIDQHLPIQIYRLFDQLIKIDKIPFKNDMKPSLSLMTDLMNFWPLWHNRIQEIIELQIQGSLKIQNTFQSQYTFASKILANLRLNDQIHRFCVKIFEPVLIELQTIEDELIVDFSGLYEKWYEIIQKLPILKRFIEGGDVQPKTVKGQLQYIYGKLKGEQQIQVLLEEMIHFQRKQSAISFLLSQVGEQQLSQSLNLRLAHLVWKKIISNRKRLSTLASNLLASIIQSYPIIPHEIKYVVRCFKVCAQRKYGELKYDDLKSFFNKIIFSQLFFAQFMNLYESRNKTVNNVNFTHLALISQKIMFGQQFYERFKFGFLNQIIIHYIPLVKDFILGFSSQSIKKPNRKFLQSIVLSFESIKFIYQMFETQKNFSFPGIKTEICKTSAHTIANKSYPLKNIYICQVQRLNYNFSQVLRQPNKIKRIIIDFLIMIDKINDKKSMMSLLQQYRCSQQDMTNNRPSVQLYAIYLQQTIKDYNLKQMIQQIQIQINTNKIQIQRIKISLEQQYNFSQNLQKYYMKILNQKRSKHSKNKILNQFNEILQQSLGFQYSIIDGKVCQSSQIKSNKTFKKCLQDICDCFLNNSQGVDGLYHIFLERIIEQLEKGVVPDNLANYVKDICGQKLYTMLNLDTYSSKQDFKLYQQMQKHGFISVSHLDVSKYEDQETLILSQSLKLLQQLQRPISPDNILKLFLEITLVIQNIILITGSASDITADVQIPLMIITIVHSRIKNLPTLLNFVQKFCADDINSSVLGQTLTLLKSAAYLIGQLDHKKLNLTIEAYQQLTIHSISNSFMIIQ